MLQKKYIWINDMTAIVDFPLRDITYPISLNYSYI